MPHTGLKVKDGLCPWSPASDRKQSSGTGTHSERVPWWPGGSAQPAVHECSSLQMCQIREGSDNWTENSRLYRAFWCFSLPVVKASCFLVHACVPFTLGVQRHYSDWSNITMCAPANGTFRVLETSRRHFGKHRRNIQEWNGRSPVLLCVPT